VGSRGQQGGSSSRQGAWRQSADKRKNGVVPALTGSRVYFVPMYQGSTVLSQDPELIAILRPFDAAFKRMCEAADSAEMRDELSNLLHHFYRLGELRSRRWAANGQKLSETNFNARVAQVPGALGALWIRSYDTHEIATVAKSRDMISDYYTKVAGILVWQCIADMPFIKPPTVAARYNDYESNLQNKPVPDALRSVFDGLVSLS
jgi:hypothetical protein